MNCVDFVLEYVDDKTAKTIDKNLQNSIFYNKNTCVTTDKWNIFSQHFHIGFCKMLNEYGEIVTIEFNNDSIITRKLNLYDETLHILLNIKDLKGVKNDEIERLYNESIQQ